jgi:hypothetical protein
LDFRSGTATWRIVTGSADRGLDETEALDHEQPNLPTPRDVVSKRSSGPLESLDPVSADGAAAPGQFQDADRRSNMRNASSQEESVLRHPPGLPVEKP